MKIAFGYKMGVGKDEAVSYLIKKLGGVKISFSEPLYEIMHYAQDKCGFPRGKDRKFLQYVGTEWARTINNDVWVNIAIDKSHDKNINNFYISDLRFPNEFEILKKSGWTCVKIVRPHQENREGSGSECHYSEVVLDSVRDEDWDYVLYNLDSLNKFYNKLDNLITDINRKE